MAPLTPGTNTPTVPASSPPRNLPGADDASARPTSAGAPVPSNGPLCSREFAPLSPLSKTGAVNDSGIYPVGSAPLSGLLPIYEYGLIDWLFAGFEMMGSTLRNLPSR